MTCTTSSSLTKCWFSEKKFHIIYISTPLCKYERHEHKGRHPIQKTEYSYNESSIFQWVYNNQPKLTLLSIIFCWKFVENRVRSFELSSFDGRSFQLQTPSQIWRNTWQITKISDNFARDSVTNLSKRMVV